MQNGVCAHDVVGQELCCFHNAEQLSLVVSLKRVSKVRDTDTSANVMLRNVANDTYICTSCGAHMHLVPFSFFPGGGGAGCKSGNDCRHNKHFTVQKLHSSSSHFA